jgi:hypothetical protein
MRFRPAVATREGATCPPCPAPRARAAFKTFTPHLIAALCAAAAVDARACSSCGCSVGTEWSDAGYTTSTGLKLDLRYDFVDQNQLRRGRSPVDTGGLSTEAIDNEIQTGTLTNYYTLGADYAFSRDWGVNLQAPYFVRLHQTIAEGDDPEQTTSNYRGIGDVRIVARYQGLFEDHSLGLQFGLKLPTGAIHQRFNGGPEAGEIVDRGLQPGSGTTDLILGVYDYAALSRDWDRFEQLQYRQPLNSREDFRPSPQLTLSLGLRYLGWTRFIPQLQLNAKWEGREIGAQGDYPNSGSRVIYASPGATLQLVKALSAYGFVQLPVYQDYTGYQLAPRYTVSAGLRYAF